jgi:LmbE family N-acetylglucosaminyl deacetylase
MNNNTKYKGTIMGIFAHPDDETFGPGATLAKYAYDGYKVVVLTATRGQAGQTSGAAIANTVGETREKELRNAGKILGVKENIVLDFFDGTLNEHQIPVLKKMIAAEVNSVKPDVIVVFEMSGISAHLDHIAVTKSVIQLYEESIITPQKIYYFGINPMFAEAMGRQSTLDVKKLCVIDNSTVWDTKIKAMKAHATQAKDYVQILKRYDELEKVMPSELYNEHFSLAATSIKDLEFPESDLFTKVEVH